MFSSFLSTASSTPAPPQQYLASAYRLPSFRHVDNASGQQIAHELEDETVAAFRS